MYARRQPGTLKGLYILSLDGRISVYRLSWLVLITLGQRAGVKFSVAERLSFFSPALDYLFLLNGVLSRGAHHMIVACGGFIWSST